MRRLPEEEIWAIIIPKDIIESPDILDLLFFYEYPQFYDYIKILCRYKYTYGKGIDISNLSTSVREIIEEHTCLCVGRDSCRSGTIIMKNFVLWSPISSLV